MEPEGSDITLKDINKVEDNEITDQISVRRWLQRHMVGKLYPSILEGEIRALIKRQEMLQ